MIQIFKGLDMAVIVTRDPPDIAVGHMNGSQFLVDWGAY